MTRDLVDVIVPVYRGADQTRRCLDSVIGSVRPGDGEIIVVDDCSPEIALTQFIDELAYDGRVKVVRNTRNLGFVGSVNRAMRLHRTRDVVLVNSDTEVANDWLSRLQDAAYACPDIGTVTPFSNNATICSYPFHGWQAGVPGTLGLARLDALFSQVNRGRIVDIPTAVGFCMFIRRDCLDAVGMFDEQAFGRGYGEENDFCRRAAEAGWRNVLAADVFVFHEGSVSFGDERFALMQAAERVLLERHPDYNDLVRQHLARDPARQVRDAMNLARAGAGPEEAAAVLHEQAQWRAAFADARRDPPSGDAAEAPGAARGSPSAEPAVDANPQWVRHDAMSASDRIEQSRSRPPFRSRALGWLARKAAALHARLHR